ncbi:putative Pentatricopeptide repeat-containing protein [Quillaja saponaria]|uniref:Pentatricopeptide repeat-containing protein n=1 Tax=Quillaja saponaria TaxID=32244 RepID=A0AAD7Q0Y4_QUISA|nr:putative Pentatricopeptide repeat-containing protein [Quillaja saponaria]
MKRVWKISDAAQAEFFCLHKTSVIPKPLAPSPFIISLEKPKEVRCTREVNSQTQSFKWANIVGLFTDKPSYSDFLARENLRQKVTCLRDELVRYAKDSDGFLRILKEKGVHLLQSYSNGSASVELLKQLESWPHLAVEVFNWRRKQDDSGNPMTSWEYSKGIKAAGRNKNVDLAMELFMEAANKQIKTTSTYNALLGALMINGRADKCQTLFRDLKREPKCSPNIVTYNILISVFGRLMLVDHMETTFQEINNLELSPTISTYNNLIAGYITAWMWDRMEKTFHMLKLSPLIPDINTYLLMLRGYAHSDRVKKIKELMKLIPEDEYRPWLNVLMIRVYAQEDSLEEMENSINEAFEHRTSVKTAGVMRSIIATYFRCNAVDRLADFVRRAECEGWRICRSLYHCKMVMYGSLKRLDEMENVLNEMEEYNLDRTKKTLWIMRNAYSLCGHRYKVAQVVGLMYKNGYEIPLEAFPS